MRLENKVALITGAGRGIGKEIACRFSSEGATVVLNDLEISMVEGVAEKLQELERKALAIQADVSNWAEVQRMVDQIWTEFGRIDILVNNAGLRKDVLFPEMSASDWDGVISVQLKGSFHGARAVIPFMMKQGTGKI